MPLPAPVTSAILFFITEQIIARPFHGSGSVITGSYFSAHRLRVYRFDVKCLVDASGLSERNSHPIRECGMVAGQPRRGGRKS